MTLLPKDIVSMLDRNGINAADLVHWMECDRLPDGGFADSFLVLSREYLHIFRGSGISMEKTFSGYAAGRRKAAGKPKQEGSGDWAWERIPFERLEALTIVNLVASGMVVAKEREERVIGAFTSGQMKQAVRFAQAFDKIKKNERLEAFEQVEESEGASCPTCGLMYPEEGRPFCPKCMKRHAVFARLLSFAGKYKLSIFFIVLFMLLNSATGLVDQQFRLSSIQTKRRGKRSLDDGGILSEQ